METIQEPPKAVETQSKIAETQPKYVEITIDLGESADRMTINGQEFYHGQTYRILRSMMPSMLEIMHNTKAHELVVSGRGMVSGPRFRKFGG